MNNDLKAMLESVINEATHPIQKEISISLVKRTCLSTKTTTKNSKPF